jgi:hypothetical protein
MSIIVMSNGLIRDRFMQSTITASMVMPCGVMRKVANSTDA